MEESDIGEAQNGNPSSLPNPNDATIVRRRSCKGYLYYTSIQKSKSKAPTCVGLSKTLSQAPAPAPSYIVGETELEASKEGRSLMLFKYACVGYSVYLDKSALADAQNKQVELPICVGFEALMHNKPADNATAPAHANKHEEDAGTFPEPRTNKPTHSTGDEYLNRFKRSASLVASGVARNASRVCNHIKESLDDMLYPYRRRPK